MSPTTLAILRAIALQTYRLDQSIGRRDGDFYPPTVYMRPLELLQRRSILCRSAVRRAVS